METKVVFNLIMYVLSASFIAYFMMWKDKRAAIKNQRRIPEKYLFMLALAGGSPGIYLGMKTPLFHKAAKPLFQFGIPFIFIFQILLILYLMFPNY